MGSKSLLLVKHAQWMCTNQGGRAYSFVAHPSRLNLNHMSLSRRRRGRGDCIWLVNRHEPYRSLRGLLGETRAACRNRCDMNRRFSAFPSNGAADELAERHETHRPVAPRQTRQLRHFVHSQGAPCVESTEFLPEKWVMPRYSPHSPNMWLVRGGKMYI